MDTLRPAGQAKHNMLFNMALVYTICSALLLAGMYLLSFLVNIEDNEETPIQRIAGTALILNYIILSLFLIVARIMRHAIILWFARVLSIIQLLLIFLLLFISSREPISKITWLTMWALAILPFLWMLYGKGKVFFLEDEDEMGISKR